MSTPSKGVIGSTFACDTCGAKTVKRAATQRFCGTCAADRGRARNRAWIKANPPDEEKRRGWQRAAHEGLRERAQDVNPGGSINWHPSECGAELAWHVRVAVPFTYALSKNRMWSRGSRAKPVFMRREIKDARAAITARIQTALQGACITPVEAKVYVDIFVQKPDGRGDAVNFVDSVCDALTPGVGIDDRWFSIRALDWEVVKVNPRIFVGVGQVETEAQVLCSYCGLIRPATEYTRNRSVKNGRSRTCKKCRAIARARKKGDG